MTRWRILRFCTTEERACGRFGYSEVISKQAKSRGSPSATIIRSELKYGRSPANNAQQSNRFTWPYTEKWPRLTVCGSAARRGPRYRQLNDYCTRGIGRFDITPRASAASARLMSAVHNSVGIGERMTEVRRCTSTRPRPLS